MALQYLYYAGQGPLQYDDTLAYPDMDPMEASRALQHYIESEPTQLYHVVRLSGLTSKLTSETSVVDSKLTSSTSTVNSKIASVISAGGVDSTARSMATSASTRAGAAQGTADDAFSKATSAALYTSVVESKLLSHMTP